MTDTILSIVAGTFFAIGTVLTIVFTIMLILEEFKK